MPIFILINLYRPTDKIYNTYIKNKIMKTVQFLGPKQCVHYMGSKVVFQSYDTIVCTVDNCEKGKRPTVTITDGQPQSKTTAKYLNRFLSQTIGVDNYKDLKK